MSPSNHLSRVFNRIQVSEGLAGGLQHLHHKEGRNRHFSGTCDYNADGAGLGFAQNVDARLRGAY